MLGITDSGDAAAAGTARSLASARPDKAATVIVPEQPRGDVSTRGEAERLLH